MRTRIDCCYKCTRPWKSPYCHIPGNCPDYTGQREELDETNAVKAKWSATNSGINQQKIDGVARAERKRRV